MRKLISNMLTRIKKMPKLHRAVIVGALFVIAGTGSVLALASSKPPKAVPVTAAQEPQTQGVTTETPTPTDTPDVSGQPAATTDVKPTTQQAVKPQTSSKPAASAQTAPQTPNYTGTPLPPARVVKYYVLGTSIPVPANSKSESFLLTSAKGEVVNWIPGEATSWSDTSTPAEKPSAPAFLVLEYGPANPYTNTSVIFHVRTQAHAAPGEAHELYMCYVDAGGNFVQYPIRIQII